MKQIFVAGTDTNVGKTVFSCLLSLKLKAQYWKPIQAGRIPETDSQFVRRHIGEANILPETLVLDAPMSPDQAAKKQNLKLKLEDFNLPKNSPLVVEGAGGLMVPLNSSDCYLDLLHRWQLPTILVARSGLGTLNHSLLSAQALKLKGLSLLAVVLVGDPHIENRLTLTTFLPTTLVLEVPWTLKLDKSWMNQQLNNLNELEKIIGEHYGRPQ